jgi:multidrug transporter EmrE-like cation transporter
MTTALVALAMITFTVVANLLLKTGATAGGAQAWPFGLLNVRVFAGLMSFGCAGIAYATLLRKLPLNIAQIFAAVQFVAVIIVSAVILAEPIPFIRWVGFGLIAAGIVLVGRSHL